MGNELIATPKGETTWYSGISQAEEVVSLCRAIDSGSWQEAAISGSTLAMDGLSLITDPMASLEIVVSAGLGWVMEHVAPLKKALDDLAGNPAVIKSSGETWKNVAERVKQVTREHAANVKADLGGWTGPASQSYRAEAAKRVAAMDAASSAATTIGNSVVQAGAMVATVRIMVRDTISTLVTALITALLPPGRGTVKAVSMIVKAGQKISRLINKLSQSLAKLGDLLAKLARSIDNILRRLRGKAPAGPRTAGHVKSVGKPSDTPQTRPSGTTSPSAAKPHGSDGGGTAPPPRTGGGGGGDGVSLHKPNSPPRTQTSHRRCAGTGTWWEGKATCLGRTRPARRQASGCRKTRTCRATREPGGSGTSSGFGKRTWFETTLAGGFSKRSTMRSNGSATHRATSASRPAKKPTFAGRTRRRSRQRPGARPRDRDSTARVAATRNCDV